MNYKLANIPEFLIGISQPDIRPISKKRYKNYSSYWINLTKDSGQLVCIVVPAGFELDGASVPRVMWSIAGLRPDGLIRAAALVHDYLYRNKGKGYKNVRKDEMIQLTREEADQIFLDLMLAAGMNKIRAKLAYIAVRMFGPRW